MRDRDELAAALEVRDRIKYDLSTPEREEILSTGDLIVEVMFCKTDFEDNNGSFPNQFFFQHLAILESQCFLMVLIYTIKRYLRNKTKLTLSYTQLRIDSAYLACTHDNYS